MIPTPNETRKLLPVLEVKDLTVNYKTQRGSVRAAEQINFNVDRGESLGLAGESGCGKTTIALSLMRLLPKAGRILKGEVLLDGVNLLGLSDAEMRQVRWRDMSIVFQGAMNALDPVFKIGEQIDEAIRTHEKNVSKEKSRDRRRSFWSWLGSTRKGLTVIPTSSAEE